MKTLLLLRHAKANPQEPGQADHNRGLSDRGKRDATRLGRWLLEEGLVPDLIISSTAKRARKTAEKVAGTCAYSRTIILREAIYEAQPSAYLSVLSEIDGEPDRVLVVGHNPGLEMLLYQITTVAATLPTAALCVVALTIDSWPEIGAMTKGRLERVRRPDELEPMEGS